MSFASLIFAALVVATPRAAPSPSAAPLDDVARGRLIEQHIEARYRSGFLGPYHPNESLALFDLQIRSWQRMGDHLRESNISTIMQGEPQASLATVARFGPATFVPLGGFITAFFEAPDHDVYFVSDAQSGSSYPSDHDARLYRLREGTVEKVALPYRCSLIEFVKQNDNLAIVRLDRTGVDEQTHTAFARLDSAGLHPARARSEAATPSASHEKCVMQGRGSAHPSFASVADATRGTLVSDATLLAITHEDVDFSVIAGGCRTTPAGTLFWITDGLGDSYTGLTYAKQVSAIPNVLFASIPAQTSRDFLAFGVRSQTVPFSYDYVILETDEPSPSAPMPAPQGSAPGRSSDLR